MLHLKGTYVYKLFRKNKLIQAIIEPNQIVRQGLVQFLKVTLGASAYPRLYPWFFGLIDSSGYSSVGFLDKPNNHSGWSEFTNYSESTRPRWYTSIAIDPLPVKVSTLNSPPTSPPNFTISGNGTIKGAFLINSSTKSGTGGYLWSHNVLTVPLDVLVDDVLILDHVIEAMGE